MMTNRNPQPAPDHTVVENNMAAVLFALMGAVIRSYAGDEIYAYYESQKPPANAKALFLWHQTTALKEQKRLEAVREKALAKLDAEERKALGV